MEEIKVYSKKHNIHGKIRDYGMVTKLSFLWQNREIEMGIRRNLLHGNPYEELGRDMIDSYIDNLAPERQRLRLHYWHVAGQEREGERILIARGIVTGHPKISDAVTMHTSKILDMHLDWKTDELVISTENNTYHCPLEYCDFKKQGKYPDILPEYKRIKENYDGKIVYPSIDPGNVLLVLANFCSYYFHSLYYVSKDAEKNESVPYYEYPHTGMFQDSYLIAADSAGIDLRYFPHYQNIEFYDECIDGKPLYLENIGDCVLYAQTSCGCIRLEPGQRKLVSKENAEIMAPVLPNGDLYPAGVL